jgi:uncharacterized protein YbbC (DUF1343 family)
MNFLVSLFSLAYLLVFTSQLRDARQMSLSDNPGQFKLGNEALLEMYDSPLKNKNIGLSTNNSGILSDGRFFLDVLNDHYKLTKIFTPEHGLRGNERNEDHVDDVTGISVISLYGNKEKPASEDLSDVDILVYDLQDVSARFYTFVNTLYYCMEAAVDNGKEIVVCDRPIIPDGNYVDGYVLEEYYKSFVGLMKLPAAYAMTCGELANFMNAEYFDNKCRLTVSKMENYKRDMKYDDLNLYWKNPSPNLYFPSTAVAYLGTCLFEGTNVSEGRGSPRPFEYIGAPFCDGNLLASKLNSMNFSGVTFEPVSFVPKKLASWMAKPKYEEEVCGGVYINITDRVTAEPFKIAVAALVIIRDLHPQFEILGTNFIDKLAGTDRLRRMLTENRSYDEIVSSYRIELEQFKEKRNKYLMY